MTGGMTEIKATFMQEIPETDETTVNRATMRMNSEVQMLAIGEATHHHKLDTSKNIKIHKAGMKRMITIKEIVILDISKREKSNLLKIRKIKNLLNLEGKENLKVDVTKSIIIHSLSIVEMNLQTSLYETNYLKIVTIEVTNAKIHLKEMKDRRAGVELHLPSTENTRGLAHQFRGIMTHAVDQMIGEEKMKTITEDEKMTTETKNVKMISIILKMITRASLMEGIDTPKPIEMIKKTNKGKMIETKTAVITEIKTNINKESKIDNVLLIDHTKENKNTKKEMSPADPHHLASKALKNVTKKVTARHSNRDLVVGQLTIEL